MKPLSILVTGGSGTIGSSLLKNLQTLPHLRLTVISHAKTDISSSKSLSQVGGQFDVVIHLAASLRMFEKNHELENTNIKGLLNILQAFCTSSKPIKFIFASSIDAITKNSDYALTKVKGEGIVRQFAQDHPNVTYLNLRIGNVYKKQPEELVSLPSWRRSLLYYELSDKKVFPIRLQDLVLKIRDFALDPKINNKTLDLFEDGISVKNIIKPTPQRLPFGRLILWFWISLGKILNKGDRVIYLSLEK